MEDCSQMPDADLLRSLQMLVKRERRNIASILSRLAEVDRRRLAGTSGFHSLFDYCRRKLRYSEGAAARRIHAARAAANYPLLYPMLASGRLSLSAISMLAPHLTPKNHRVLIRRALGRSTRDLEALIAEFAPKQAIQDRIRHIGPKPAPADRPGDPSAMPSGSLFQLSTNESGQAAAASQPRMEAEPSADSRGRTPDAQEQRRVQFSFIADEELLRRVERAKELLRHKHPAGRLENVFVEALEALLERIEPERRIRRKEARERIGDPRQAGPSPRSERTRAIPQWVKDKVWRRDGGRCAFKGQDGLCGARGGLQYDHVQPWALGGRSDDPENIRLLCRLHNGLEARRVFGDAIVDAAIARRK